MCVRPYPMNQFSAQPCGRTPDRLATAVGSGATKAAARPAAPAPSARIAASCQSSRIAAPIWLSSTVTTGKSCHRHKENASAPIRRTGNPSGIPWASSRTTLRRRSNESRIAGRAGVLDTHDASVGSPPLKQARSDQPATADRDECAIRSTELVAHLPVERSVAVDDLWVVEAVHELRGVPLGVLAGFRLALVVPAFDGDDLRAVGHDRV